MSDWAALDPVKAGRRREIWADYMRRRENMKQTIGRCEPCGETIDGSGFDHMAAVHPNQMFECWADPESGAWTIFRRAPEIEGGDDRGAERDA